MEKCIAAIWIFCAVLNSRSFAEVNYHGHQVWRVTPDSIEVLQTMKQLEKTFQLDFWIEPAAVGRPVDFHVPQDKIADIIKFLKSRGVRKHQVYIHDLEKLIENVTPKHRDRAVLRSQSKAIKMKVSDFDYSAYHPAEDVNDWMDMVIEEYEFATKHQIGFTYEGRPMYSLSFKKNTTSKPKPVVFVDALIHSREWITTASLMFIFKEMLQNPNHAHMIEDADWYFVPMINIDGYVETWSRDRMWRKTKSTGASAQCSGVDANRNWNAYWGDLSGSSPEPCATTYHGFAPTSEPEIRHLSSYVSSFGAGNIDAYVSVHSYSQLILYPYNYKNVPSAHDQLLNATARRISEAMYNIHGTKYVYGRGAVALYPFSGTTTDWTYDEAKVDFSFTFELRDTGEFGFLLPAEQIIPTGEEFPEGLTVLKNIVLENFNEGSGAEA